MNNEQSIENLAVKIIEKGNHYPLLSKQVLILALPIMIPVEREKILEHLVNKMDDLLDDKEGNRLAIMVINYAGVKERKQIAKSLKDKVYDMLTTENSLSYTILQKLVLSIDDTVLTSKMILRTIQNSFQEIIETKTGFNFITSIFAPKHSAVNTFEIPVDFTTSKKDDDVRYREIGNFLIDESVEYLKDANRETVTKDPRFSRFMSSVLRFILRENLSKHYGFVHEIINLYLDER